MEIEWKKRGGAYHGEYWGWELYTSTGNHPCGVYPTREERNPNPKFWVVWVRGTIVSEPFESPEEAKAMAVALYRLGELHEDRTT